MKTEMLIILYTVLNFFPFAQAMSCKELLDGTRIKEPELKKEESVTIIPKKLKINTEDLHFLRNESFEFFSLMLSTYNKIKTNQLDYDQLIYSFREYLYNPEPFKDPTAKSDFENQLMKALNLDSIDQLPIVLIKNGYDAILEHVDKGVFSEREILLLSRFLVKKKVLKKSSFLLDDVKFFNLSREGAENAYNFTREKNVSTSVIKKFIFDAIEDPRVIDYIRDLRLQDDHNHIKKLLGDNYESIYPEVIVPGNLNELQFIRNSPGSRGFLEDNKRLARIIFLEGYIFLKTLNRIKKSKSFKSFNEYKWLSQSFVFSMFIQTLHSGKIDDMISRGEWDEKNYDSFVQDNSRSRSVEYFEEKSLSLGFKKETISSLIDFLEYSLFNLPLPLYKENITSLLLESIKSELIPIKAEITKVKNQNNAEQQREMLKKSRDSRPFLLLVKNESTSTSTKKVRKRKITKSNKKNLKDEVAKDIVVEEYTLVKDVNIQADKIYTFLPARGYVVSTQTITFTDGVLKKINEQKTEYMNSYIQAVNNGFTSRASSSGLKRIGLNRGLKGYSEIRTGLSSFRLIVKRDKDQWTVVEFLHKDKVDLYINKLL